MKNYQIAQLDALDPVRAIGQMKIVNIPVPAFDPEDEWFD